VALSDETRLATIEQILRDYGNDLQELRKDARDDHHRLRTVEAAVLQMTTMQTAAREAEAAQYKRLELRVQWLSLAIAFAGFVLAVAIGVATYFHAGG
jgi:hypothetical protein